MGFIMSHLILFVLFYLVFVPLGVMGRLMGKEFLQLKMKKNGQASYWEMRNQTDEGPERYEKQY